MIVMPLSVLAQDGAFDVNTPPIEVSETLDKTLNPKPEIQEAIDLDKALEGQDEEEIIPLPAAMSDKPVVKLRWLNKITARNKTVAARIGDTIKIGDLYMKAKSCRQSSPLERSESAAFVQIWEGGGTQSASPEWVFSGWMFASSPGLSAMDHPIYDVWVLDCLDKIKDAGPSNIKAEDLLDIPAIDTTPTNKGAQESCIIKA